jgi:sugar phosphate permease
MVGLAGGVDGLLPSLLGGVHSIEAYPTDAVGTIRGLFPCGGQVTRGGVIADRKE